MPQASACTKQRAARILLAEDDPPSRHYMHDALRELGAEVTVHGDGKAALAEATSTLFDLLLIDRRLPSLSGAALLRRLRERPDAASRDSRAIASSAHWTPGGRRAALAAGFTATLAKPCTTGQLRELLQSHLPPLAQAVRDDAAALYSAGGAGNLQALRRLFARELRQWCDEWPALATRPAVLHERLHRLCASAGFCGAPALASAARELRGALEAGGSAAAQSARFGAILADTRAQFPQPDDAQRVAAPAAREPP
ncbi:MAG TPA: response regulator [Rhodanobacteraceae bacterium]|nr:response regulator [Rhodanobacteraceae bacterium]